MPNYRYRALTQSGEIVSGTISAPTAAEVARRIEYLDLLPIETVVDERPGAGARLGFSLGQQSRAEDVTAFTRDLALLLRAGARIDDALDLMATDLEVGRLRPVIGKIRADVMAGESFGAAIEHQAPLFPPIYAALVRVGETAGTLDHVLEVLAHERAQAEALRRRLADALRYPVFVLIAAAAVLTFFLMFVLPQFGAVLRDFGAKLDPLVTMFLGLSEALRDHRETILGLAAAVLGAVWLTLRRPGVRAAAAASLSHLPLLRTVATYHRTALFCRNLGILLGSGVSLPAALRILIDMMATSGAASVWSETAERVRHGGKLSDALNAGGALPEMAVRMLRLGEETGHLPLLAGRVADFYEAKLQRSLDRVVGLAGPVAIIVISVVVGGLIVSVMTSLLSVSQLIG